MRDVAPSRANGFAVSRDLVPRLVAVEGLSALGQEARHHSKSQIKKLEFLLGEYGFVSPILIDEQQRVVAGWGLVLAARQMQLPAVPAVTVTDLSEAQLRSLRLALNKVAEKSEWDNGLLAIELGEIVTLAPDIDLRTTAFEMGEIDVLLAGESEEDELPPVDASNPPTTQLGDLWVLGDHRILCGDALVEESYRRLLDADRAELVFADVPYNVPIDGHASGLGRVRHEDFAMASGEMSEAEFTAFLQKALGLAAAYSIDGAIHFVCMDWRHMRELLAAGDAVYSELKNLAVWNKSNAGMGSLYRSKHELVFVFKNGTAPHINNVSLGRHGRSRANVWDYPSQNALGAKSKLSLHATSKPVGLIADAIRDCSNRGGLVLDPFGGSGTTIVAAEVAGRRARLIEIEPRFVDVTIRRWQNVTGGRAVHAETGRPFGQPSGQAEGQQ